MKKFIWVLPLCLSLSISAFTELAYAGFFDEVNEDARTGSPDRVALSPEQRGFVRNFEMYNDISIQAFCLMAIVILLGCFFARTVTINTRGSYSKPNLLIGMMAVSANIATISVVVISSFNTHWYWPILILLGGSLIAGVIINSNKAARLRPIQTITSLIILILSGIFFYLIVSQRV